MWETVASSVINRPTGVVVELNTIVKINKYKGFHEGHHFIPMARRCTTYLVWYGSFHQRMCSFFSWWIFERSFFCIQFFKQCVSIILQCALTFAVKRKIVLVGDACFRPPIIIRFHDLHASDIRGTMGEITSYHKD
jgi:hypothetical protein